MSTSRFGAQTHYSSGITAIARSPQSYEKRRRELNKQLKRQQKLARRLERNTEKREDPNRPFGAPVTDEPSYDEFGNPIGSEGSTEPDKPSEPRQTECCA